MFIDDWASNYEILTSFEALSALYKKAPKEALALINSFISRKYVPKKNSFTKPISTINFQTSPLATIKSIKTAEIKNFSNAFFKAIKNPNKENVTEIKNGGFLQWFICSTAFINELCKIFQDNGVQSAIVPQLEQNLQTIATKKTVESLVNLMRDASLDECITAAKDLKPAEIEQQVKFISEAKQTIKVTASAPEPADNKSASNTQETAAVQPFGDDPNEDLSPPEDNTNNNGPQKDGQQNKDEAAFGHDIDNEDLGGPEDLNEISGISPEEKSKYEQLMTDNINDAILEMLIRTWCQRNKVKQIKEMVENNKWKVIISRIRKWIRILSDNSLKNLFKNFSDVEQEIMKKGDITQKNPAVVCVIALVINRMYELDSGINRFIAPAVAEIDSQKASRQQLKQSLMPHLEPAWKTNQTVLMQGAHIYSDMFFDSLKKDQIVGLFPEGGKDNWPMVRPLIHNFVKTSSNLTAKNVVTACPALKVMKNLGFKLDLVTLKVLIAFGFSKGYPNSPITWTVFYGWFTEYRISGRGAQKIDYRKERVNAGEGLYNTMGPLSPGYLGATPTDSLNQSMRVPHVPFRPGNKNGSTSTQVPNAQDKSTQSAADAQDNQTQGTRNLNNNDNSNQNAAAGAQDTGTQNGQASTSNAPGDQSANINDTGTQTSTQAGNAQNTSGTVGGNSNQPQTTQTGTQSQGAAQGTDAQQVGNDTATAQGGATQAGANNQGVTGTSDVDPNQPQPTQTGTQSQGAAQDTDAQQVGNDTATAQGGATQAGANDQDTSQDKNDPNSGQQGQIDFSQKPYAISLTDALKLLSPYFNNGEEFANLESTLKSASIGDRDLYCLRCFCNYLKGFSKQSSITSVQAFKEDLVVWHDKYIDTYTNVAIADGKNEIKGDNLQYFKGSMADSVQWFNNLKIMPSAIVPSNYIASISDVVNPYIMSGAGGNSFNTVFGQILESEWSGQDTMVFLLNCLLYDIAGKTEKSITINGAHEFVTQVDNWLKDVVYDGTFTFEAVAGGRYSFSRCIVEDDRAQINAFKKEVEDLAEEAEYQLKSQSLVPNGYDQEWDDLIIKYHFRQIKEALLKSSNSENMIIFNDKLLECFDNMRKSIITLYLLDSFLDYCHYDNTNLPYFLDADNLAGRLKVWLNMMKAQRHIVLAKGRSQSRELNEDDYKLIAKFIKKVEDCAKRAEAAAKAEIAKGTKK